MRIAIFHKVGPVSVVTMAIHILLNMICPVFIRLNFESKNSPSS